MAKQHKRIQDRLAGKSGKTEVPISGKRRLDVRKPGVAIEVERSGSTAGIERALARLRTQQTRRELRVPQKDLTMAIEAAKRQRAKLTVANLGGTKRRRINP